jgi:two-component system, LuxR family, response regulator FixJ
MDFKPTIHIIEDDPLQCRSLAMLLQSVPFTYRTFSNAADFLATFNFEEPACLLVDIQLPGMSGLELQDKLLERGCIHPVIFLTGHAEVPFAVAAMKKGAADFIEKPFVDSVLLEAIQRAIQSHTEVWRSRRFVQDVQGRLKLLSPREREVLMLVVNGKQTKQIATMLGLSPKTVDNHRASILEKMGASGVVDLVRLVLLADPQSLQAEQSHPVSSI